MVQKIPAGHQDRSKDIRLVKEALGQSTENAGSHQSSEKLHGSDPQCKSCHQKLDPVANTFRGSSLVLGARPSPGALVFRKNNGDLERIDVAGLGELGEAITQQTEYLECQVSHFWNWVIGEDVELSRDKVEQLVNQFEALGRRPKDFIGYLANSRDFFDPLKFDPKNILFSQVKPILQRCDSCHRDEPLAPILGDSYPYSTNPFDNSYVVSQLAWNVDLKEESDEDSMPPANAGWKLAGRDRDLLKAWVISGAKDDAGKPGLTQDQIGKMKQAVSLKGKLSSDFQATTGLSFRRIVTGPQLTNLLFNYLPKDTPRGHTCLQPGNVARDQIGFIKPNTGKPQSKFISPLYLKWWIECINSNQHHLRTALENDPLLKRFLADYKSWEKLTRAEQIIVFDSISSHFLGGILIGSKKFFHLRSQVLGKMPTTTESGGKLSATGAAELILFSILTSEEFLTY